jgi:hypothetical protein
MNVLAGALAVAASAYVEPVAAAAEPAQLAAAEIQYLLQATENSGCEFYRNGSWHSAAEARTHLAQKYDQAQKQSALRSADDFIEVVATRSSVTGELYLLRCQDAKPVASASWFRETLKRYREVKGSSP